MSSAANPYRALVNQRLYFCKLQLAQLSAMQEQAAATAAISAQLESVRFHLLAVYRSFLLELCAAQGINSAVATSARQLVEQLNALGRHSALLDYWSDRELAMGWLQDLLHLEQVLLAPPVMVAPDNSYRGDIAAIQLSGDAPLACAPALQRALDDLNTIIPQQRETLLEY